MCGIAGILSKKDPVKIELLKLLNDGIAHRGPDDEGYFVQDISKDRYPLKGESTFKKFNFKNVNDNLNKQIRFGMSHRRFSIIDISSMGHQPMIDEHTGVAISFNGEIYNYLEIRKELESEGEKNFLSKSDTEVILRAYQKWGSDCFKKFNGFWAIAILDNNKLILSRDRIGKKPLYYSDDNGILIFCSEIRPILDIRNKLNFNNDLNEKALFDYLELDRRNVNFDSMFKQIKQIDPGTCYEIDLENKIENKIYSYWSLDQGIQENDISLNKFSELFREKLSNSIDLRLRADVPIEANLSGGLDSSSIVALSSKILKKQNKKLVTHTFRYVGDTSLDETENAKSIADFCGAEFNVLDINESSIWNEIDQLVLKSDEPVHSLAALVQSYAWEEIARRGYKVILHGSANDEIMLGYDYLKKIELLNRFKSFNFNSLTRDLIFEPVNFLKLTKWLLGQNFTKNINFSKYYSENFNMINEGRNLSFNEHLKKINKNTKDRMLNDLLNLRIPYWCNLMDKNMMSVPVEVRMPFLDHDFLDFIFSVPKKYLLRDGYTKYLLRYSLSGMLPKNILWNRTKTGFSSPKKKWLNLGQKQLLAEFDDDSLKKYLNVELLRKNLDTLDESFIWRLTNFSIWHRVNRL
tara:strand:+ start:522 stop:2429 length:1908 start_codon:yes stop_codon:yes gene_type:complete